MKYLTMLIVISVGLAGCGRGSGNPEGGVNPGFLAGTWSLECQDFGEFFLGIDLYFGANRMVRTVKNFDQNCTQIERKIAIDYDLALPAASELKDNAYEMNLIVAGSSAVLYKDELVELYNQISRCGDADWAIDEAKDLSDAEPGCYEGDFPPKVTSQIFTIVRTQDDTLEIGENSSLNDGSSVEKRHIAFSNVTYTR